MVIHPGVPLELNAPRVPLSNPSFISGPHGPGVRVGVLVFELVAVHVDVFVNVFVIVGVAVKVGNVPVGEMVTVGVRVDVRVIVGVRVSVGVGVMVGVQVASCVAVPVGVSVSSGAPMLPPEASLGWPATSTRPTNSPTPSTKAVTPKACRQRFSRSVLANIGVTSNRNLYSVTRRRLWGARQVENSVVDHLG